MDSTIHLKTTDSTNDYLAKLMTEEQVPEGTVVVADFQTAGRGQQGNKWSSAVGKNLLFSVLIKDFNCFGLTPLPASRQFLLSRAAALSVLSFLEKWGLHACIKWPNDIYVGDKKIAGILIENGLQGKALVRSIIGIGINLGQREFPPELPNPTSVALLTGVDFSREVLQTELQRFAKIFEDKLQEAADAIKDDYEQRLYRKDVWSSYRETSTGARFEARLLGTEDGGRVLLEVHGGSIRTFAFKELEFLI